MKISVVTLFPELYGPFVQTSLIKRACERGDLSCDIVSLFSICAPKERADSPTFGHGPGLLLRPEVVERAITQQEAAHGKAVKIFFSPQGTVFDQQLAFRLYERIMAQGGHCLLLPARYEGMDARVEEEYADELISVGDFVLMGGDLPAMMLMEALLRFVPGLVGKQESVERDSFMGPFVDYPEYTAPVVWHGREVPEVLRSGNHAAMQAWRREQAAKRTVERHFSWLRSHELDEPQKKLARQYIPPHYAVLMHDGVLVQDGREGTSSVTSIDIHDISRSACTYGIKKYFVVTSLVDQQLIVKTLLDFWQQGAGVAYNPSRHEAVSQAILANSLDEVVAHIEQSEGKKPLLLGTSAREVAEIQNCTYYDQERVWREQRPVVIVFGTAQGLGPSILQRCEYVLGPIEGFSSFNHLSVRSAAAVIFDRWLGINKKT